MGAETAKAAGPVWLGIDVGKSGFDVAAHPAWRPGAVALSSLPQATFPRSREGVTRMLAWLDKLNPEGQVRAVMEATGRYSMELAGWLLAERPALAPAIADPKAVAHFIRSLRLRNKTDRTDAAALARFGAERSPADWQPPTQEYARLRTISRERTFIVASLVAARNRLGEIGDDAVVLKVQRRIVADLERALASIEKAMHQHVEACPDLFAAVRRLDTIPGVAFITAATILGELGDLTRFRRSRSLSAFAGVSPRRFESGDSVRGRTRMCKQGGPRARQALYLASLAAIRTPDNGLASFYAELVGKGKPKMAAVGAVMRKMLVLMRALLISQTDYGHPMPPKNSSRAA